MKNIIKIISSLVLCFALIFSLSIVAFADTDSVTVSLKGQNCGLVAGASYKVTLNVSDASVGGLQGTIKFDTVNFDFVSVTVKNSIAKLNRLTKGTQDVTTTKDVIIANEEKGTVDFVVVSDKKSSEILTFNFKVSNNSTSFNNLEFSLNNVKVSQGSGVKRVETVGITNITASTHQFGAWKITIEPTLFAVGQKTRTCSVCEHKETADVAKLSAEKAEIKLIGASRIVLVKEADMEFSLDGKTWQKSNIFVGLTKNTEYKVYSRLFDSASGNASGVSDALTVTTIDKDGIIGIPQAEDLSELRKVLIFEDKYAWADVNGDVNIDIRDIVRLKKASAGYYEKYQAGDFNLDGDLDIKDYNILSDYLNGNSESINYYIGDVNSDGILDIDDLNLLK